MLWNIGTRSPATAIASVRGAFRSGAGLVAGFLRFALGLALFGGAALIVLPVLGPALDAFAPIQTGMLLAALIVEHLIGDEARASLRLR